MDLEKFARWCVQEGPFSGCDLDGGDVQAKAFECGLLTKTKYDPAVHGEDNADYVEPGDAWFVFSDEFNKVNAK